MTRASGSIGASPSLLKQMAVPANLPVALSAPAGWASAWQVPQWTPTVSVTRDRLAPSGSVGIAAEALFDLFSAARAAPANIYYVSPAGNDGAAGTSAAPWRSIWKAVAAANASARPAKVVVAAGDYPRANNFTNGGNTLPTVDIAFVATGGRATVGTWDEFATPAADASYANCYSWAVANVNRVTDRLSRDRFGNAVELAFVASPAICNRTPGSWATNAGTVYVNRGDGAAVTTANTRLYRASTAAFKAVTAASFFFGGATPADGFDMIGGSSSGALSYAPTLLPAAMAACIAANCTFKHAGGQVEPGANGVSISAIHGLAAFFNCNASANGSDGFNCHNIGMAGAKAHFLTVNCTGFDNGRAPTQSCNGWTTHEDVTGLDICGLYEGHHGGTVRSVGTTRSWLVETIARGDLGDVAFGGTTPPIAFKTDETAIYWLDGARADMPAGGFACSVSAGAAIRTRNMPPQRHAVGGTGLFSAW